MQIDSGHNGYPYPARPRTIERVIEEPVQREVEQPRPSGSTLTGSSTFLSSSLANALWVMGDSREQTASTTDAPQAPTNVPDMPVDWVQELYQEFSESR